MCTCEDVVSSLHVPKEVNHCEDQGTPRNGFRGSSLFLCIEVKNSVSLGSQ